MRTTFKRDPGTKEKPLATKGFTLLFAVLISSILLAIGIAIFDITVRELKLSSAVRESQYAFFAADTGIECAIYWDYQGAFVPGANGDISCGGQTITVTAAPSYGSPATFSAALPTSNRCVIATITKTQLAGDPGGGIPVRTAIVARGYNVPCADVATDVNTIERALRALY